jgi:uncharacterized protein involved in exopolysaccharide biosynthesis
VNPSRNDPSFNRLTDIATASEFRRRASVDEVEVEPQRIVWLRLLWAERRFLVRAGASGIVLSLLVAFLLPVRYESRTRLMPPEEASSGLSMLAALATRGGSDSSSSGSGSSSSESGGGLGGGSLGRLATDFLGLKTSGALLVDMLSGPTVQDTLIKKFDLRKIYHDRYWQQARKDLDKHTDIKEDRKSGVISISVTDRDPHRAQQLAQAYVDALNDLLAHVSTSSARRERMFLEERLKTVKENLDTASEEFSTYASKIGALDVPSQAKSMVDSEAQLQGQLVAAESELQGLEQIYTDNNIQVRTLRARIAALKRQVENFSGNKDDPSSQQSQITGDLPSIRKLPLVGVRWANLYRETKIQEVVYEMLTQEYEFAKVQEAKEIPTINVLDQALLPEKIAFPPRGVVVVLGVFLSLVFASIFVIGGAMWHLSESPEKQLATEIWGQIASENAKSQAKLQQAWNRFSVHFQGHNGHR